MRSSTNNILGGVQRRFPRPLLRHPRPKVSAEHGALAPRMYVECFYHYLASRSGGALAYGGW